MANCKKRLSRRERERLRHRGQMLKAALELFSQKGYQNVSMHEIASHAEFAIGTLYKFFKNKEDLYNSLLTDTASQFHAALSAALDGEWDCQKKLRRYIRSYWDQFQKNAAAVRLYFSETTGVSYNLRSNLTRELQAYYDDIIEKLGAVFAEGIEKGVYCRIDPKFMAISFESLINTFLFYWLDDPENHPFEPAVPAIERIFFKGVMLNNREDKCEKK